MEFKQHTAFIERIVSQLGADATQFLDALSADPAISVRRNTMKVDLTKAEEVEVRAKYEYYSKRMSEDISILFSAFIHKNNLFYKYDDFPKGDDKPVDKERVKKIIKMMNSMDRATYYKQLKEVA